MGLIYEIKINDKNDIKIKMTLTNPNCPVAGTMPESVGKSVEKLSNLNSIEVSLVWDPKWHKDLMSEEAKLALDIFSLIYNGEMKSVLSITSKATEQIKKIMSNAPDGMDSVVIGVDKSGCSGYAYKLDFGKSSDFKNFEIIDQDGAKVLIDPKATMFLLGSVMDYRQDKLASRFVFDNPNEKNTCGCGESFSI